MKMMKTLIILFTIFFTSSAFADADIVGEKTILLKNGRGKVLVTSRKTEVLLGLPYTLEIRILCNGAKSQNWPKLPSDSEAVCDVKPNSATLTPDGSKISIKIRETNSANFNAETRAAQPADLQKIKPICKASSTEYFFEVQNYCVE